MNKTEIKIHVSQLADDTTLFVDSIQSGNEAMKEVTAFGMYAGPKLNFVKTQTLALNCDFQECVDGLQWSEEPVKYLGVFMSIKNENLEHLNWFTKLDEIKRIVNMWKNEKSYLLWQDNHYKIIADFANSIRCNCIYSSSTIYN